MKRKKELRDILLEQTYKQIMNDESLIRFYCKKCKEVIDPKRHGKKLQFTCPECKGKHVSYGCDKSVTDFYHLKDRKKV